MNETWWVKPEQLDDDQKKVVELPRDKSYLVMGPPGSGKTNLVLLRANYLVRSGRPNILILVLTRTLREFMVNGSKTYAFADEKIQTSLNWGKEFLWQHHVKLDSSGDFEDVRESLCTEIDKVVRTQKLSRIYDAILLDEAHDYLPKEIALFSRLAKQIFAVADRRQKIYNGADAVETLESTVNEVYELRFHYRSGKRICVAADTVGKVTDTYEPLIKKCNYDEKARPSTVTSFRCKDLAEQITRIVKTLKLQTKAYPEEMLGVIVPRREDLDQVWQGLATSDIGHLCVLQSSQSGYESFGDRKICVCTIHSAKGLEFRAVHIPACEGIKRFATQRRMTFTAITRAKTALSIYYSDDLPGYLESALVAVKPQSGSPKLKELFPGDS
jgi:superfamily I DNA/RNA helicase